MRLSKLNLMGILAACFLLLGGIPAFAKKNNHSTPAKKAGPPPAAVGGGRPVDVIPVPYDVSVQVTESTNALGQKVFSMPDLHHDISRPLSEMERT